MADDRRKRESFHRARYQSIANERATRRRSRPAVVVATLPTLPAPFFLRRPPSASRLIPPPRGQMGVPAYVKAALCSAHPRSAICQCQGASAVSMETPPASRQRARASERAERSRGRPSGFARLPPRRHNATPGLPPPPPLHGPATTLSSFLRHSPTPAPRGACPRGKPPRFPVSPPSPMGAPQDA